MSSIDLTLPPGVSVAPHADFLVKPPAFWDARKAYLDYEPDLDGAFIAGVEYRRKHGLRTAAQLKQAGISNLLMLTDLQKDFRDGGRLGVNGTNDVVLRACVRLLNGTIGAEYFTDLVHSQDGHCPWHISFAARWQDTKGQPLDLRTNKAVMLDLADEKKAVFKATCPTPNGLVDMGYFQSEVNALKTVSYWHHLQKTGQGSIWAFAMHCKLGTDGVNLHPLLGETLAFVEGARVISPTLVSKGHIQDTDWFGPFEPCMPDPTHAQGQFQKGIVDQFALVDGRVEFFGVAEDFCNYYAERQVIKHFQDTPFFDKMAFATDGTAAIVPGAQHVRTLYDEAKDLGVHFFTHDEPFRPTA